MQLYFYYITVGEKSWKKQGVFWVFFLPRWFCTSFIRSSGSGKRLLVGLSCSEHPIGPVFKINKTNKHKRHMQTVSWLCACEWPWLTEAAVQHQTVGTTQTKENIQKAASGFPSISASLFISESEKERKHSVPTWDKFPPSRQPACLLPGCLLRESRWIRVKTMSRPVMENLQILGGVQRRRANSCQE